MAMDELAKGIKKAIKAKEREKQESEKILQWARAKGTEKGCSWKMPFLYLFAITNGILGKGAILKFYLSNTFVL